MSNRNSNDGTVADSSTQPKLKRPAKLLPNPVLAVVRFFQKLSDERLAKKLVKRLYTLPKDEWISAEHTFNRWEFPMKFYNLVPCWWFKQKKMDRAMRVISPVMDIVNKEFGRKEELRYHNVYRGKMTNDEFEFWYNADRNNDDLNAYYDKKFKVETIQWWKDDVFEKLSAANVW